MKLGEKKENADGTVSKAVASLMRLMMIDDQAAAADSRSPNRAVQSLRLLNTLLFCSCLTAAALSLLARFWWLADLAANLRFQWVIGLSVSGLVALLIRNPVIVVISAAVVVFQVPWFWSTEISADADTGLLTITTANVYTGNRQHQRVAEELRRHDADVVLVVELSTSLSQFLIDDFGDEYPHRVFVPRDRGNFGIGLMSRIPPTKMRVVYFGNPTLPAIEFAATVDGHDIMLIGIHTLPPMGSRNFHHRNHYLKQVASNVQEFRDRDPDASVIVAGDFNLTPWSPIFGDFCADSKLESFVGSVWWPTWYRFPSPPFGLVLDHVLTTGDLTCVHRTVGNDVGSDHRFVTHSLSAQ